MCCPFFVVWRIGFARISAVLASSFRVFTFMVVVWGGSVISLVSIIRSLYWAWSFSICGFSVVGLVFR